MSEQTVSDLGNAGTVMSIYEAFGRGDVPSILATLADDVAWDHGVRDAGLPWIVAGERQAAATR